MFIKSAVEEETSNPHGNFRRLPIHDWMRNRTRISEFGAGAEKEIEDVNAGKVRRVASYET